ncbi:MAG: ABC transporter permease [Planctomycetes bacterium]|nr:ABC transporter permease [Planctomycetota bacterium]
MLRSIWILARKDLRLLGRDPMSLFFIAVFPVILGVAFGLMNEGFADEPEVAEAVLLVHDADASEVSRDFIAALDAQAAVAVKRVDSLDAGRQEVMKGRALGLFEIVPGFGESAGLVFAEKAPRVGLAIDPSRPAEGQLLRGAVMQGIGDLVARRSPLPGREGRALELVTIEAIALGHETADGAPVDRIRSGYDVSFPSAILWGVLGCIAGFAISIARERASGTFYRLSVAPQPRAAILLGKGLACALTAIAVVLFLTLIGCALGLELRSPFLFVLATLGIAWCFSGLMMALATISRSENAVAGAGWALNVTMSLIGGGMIPLAFMPAGMRTLSDFSPVKWGILALEGAIWRGFDLVDLLPALGVLILLGALGYLFGVRRLAAIDS